MANFSSLNTALSAMRYQQVVLDVSSTNIANGGTDGYVRRRVVGETVGAPATPALWSRTNEIGAGVRASGIDRMVDQYLDNRGRAEHAKQSFLDVQADALARVETGLAEPGDNGVSGALANFRATLHDLVNAPGSDAARSQVLSAANTLADAIRLQARNLADEAGDQRSRLLATVQEVNDTATQLAATNHSIAAASLTDGDTASLLDERDRLSMKLAELTGGTAKLRGDGGMDVEIDGQPLVSGSTTQELQITAGVKPDGSADGNATAYAIGGTAVTGLSGEVGGISDLLDLKLPTHLKGLNDIARQLAKDINLQHQRGYDATGAAGTDKFFEYTEPDVAASLSVGIDDPKLLAASSRPKDPAAPDMVLDTGNADALIGAITVDDGYQRLVNVFGTVVASTRRLAANQQALTSQIDASREQLAGVSLDEETVNMLSAQRAYEAAARVMTTVDSMLDTLINRTGMTR
jgi:flagellar hook-associated protein 1 FlgK